MNTEVSKELLIEVIKETITKHNMAFSEVLESCYIEDNNKLMINYKTTHGIILGYIINIYELAHKCKEWAYKYHKIIINSRTTSKTKDINGYAEIIKSCDYLYGDYADTEVEAIFKACQWILDNKK